MQPFLRTRLFTRAAGCGKKTSLSLSLKPANPPSSHNLSRLSLTSYLSTRLLTTSNSRLATPMAAQTDPTAADFASSHQITPESLESKLRNTLPSTTHISIQDMSGGCGQAFNAIIVSPEFDKKSLLARHRLVNNALKDEIKAIHAWTPKCLTPEQWEKEQQRGL
ncbi:hypothetical protein PV10_00025 [Exophiala mesophila]|uniref:BolA protein n=1 Tax=Exophiala mesophila TaxID=212818 RepID=A0A0D1Y630_EXOME|nr:uncharacterized protein PV10_00025 [Exophiala mesophila]KIV96121.1 hypothetical protein PV10_00025 [Exophiala mesophila]